MAKRTPAKHVEHVDRKVTRAAASASGSPVVKALGRLSEVGDQPPMRVLCAATIAAGAVLRDRRLAVTGARMLAAHTLATWAKTRIKRRIDRTRPDHARAVGYRAEAGNSDDHDLNSFPSGHTAGAVAVAEAVARDYPGAATPARVAAGAIAAVQVPRAKHFAGDVLVGAAIGWVAERVTSAVIDRVLPMAKEAAPEPAPAPPPPARPAPSAPFAVALSPAAGLRTRPR